MTDNSNAAPELLPCPFCGGKAYLFKDYPPDADGTFYSYKCRKCGAKSKEHYAVEEYPIFYEQVRSDWNTRAAPSRAALAAMLKAERAKAYERAAVEISDYQAFTKYAQEPLTNEMCAAIRALAQEDE